MSLWKKQEAYEKLVEMSRNGDYKTRKLLDYLYHQKYYKLVVIDSSRQRNASTSQQVSFVEKIEEDNGAKMFFITEEKKKTLF